MSRDRQTFARNVEYMQRSLIISPFQVTSPLHYAVTLSSSTRSSSCRSAHARTGGIRHLALHHPFICPFAPRRTCHPAAAVIRRCEPQVPDVGTTYPLPDLCSRPWKSSRARRHKPQTDRSCTSIPSILLHSTQQLNYVDTLLTLLTSLLVSCARK